MGYPCLTVLAALWAAQAFARPTEALFSRDGRSALASAQRCVVRVAQASGDLFAFSQKHNPLMGFGVDLAEGTRAPEATAPEHESNRRWETAFLSTAVVLTVACLLVVLLGLGIRRVNHELALHQRVQAELERTRDELQRANQEKTELLRMVAHDLRNPLTSLTLNTEAMAVRPPDAETLSDMRNAIDLMRSLIALLVDREALERGRRTLHWSRINPGKEAAAAVATVSEAARRKGIDVVVQAEPELPELESDPRAFRQVVDNLVSNAVKYAPPGSSVHVDVARTTQSLRIAVRDEGPGVPVSERVSIFQKFQVGSARPTGGESSTGLGLWIVSRIVQELRGRVWCEGARGRGSVFVVELPIASRRPDGASA